MYATKIWIGKQYDRYIKRNSKVKACKRMSCDDSKHIVCIHRYIPLILMLSKYFVKIRLEFQIFYLQ